MDQMGFLYTLMKVMSPKSHKIMCALDLQMVWCGCTLLFTYKGIPPYRWQNWVLKPCFQRSFCLKVSPWATSQHHQHHQGAHLKCKFIAPFPHRSLKVGPRNLCFNKISRWFLCVLKFGIYCSKAVDFSAILPGGLESKGCTEQLFWGPYLSYTQVFP